jgi:hypothetical protein
VAHNEDHLPAIVAFVWSGAFPSAFRTLNKKVSVNNGYMTKVPFDLAKWRATAEAEYPDALSEPYSDEPTQWIFHGHPREAEAGTELHVALARLAGYSWPAESDETMSLSAEARIRLEQTATLPAPNPDGLLALIPVLGERPLADRLRAYCAAAWGKVWAAEREAALVASACERSNDKPPSRPAFEAWLRNYAARQHAKLFHDRPFLWWITDGRADGFMRPVRGRS